jgi:hypothetical protein
MPGGDSLNGFTYRYAVRMPNGDLFAPPQPQRQVINFGMPSIMRDMLGLYAMREEFAEPEPQIAPEPRIFDNREDAEQLLNNLRDTATQFGVDNYGGTIVTQLCTPFTPGDPGIDFADEVVKWLNDEDIPK